MSGAKPEQMSADQAMWKFHEMYCSNQDTSQITKIGALGSFDMPLLFSEVAGLLVEFDARRVMELGQNQVSILHELKKQRDERVSQELENKRRKKSESERELEI